MTASDQLRSMADAGDDLTDEERAEISYLIAVVLGGSTGGDNSAQQALLAFADGFADQAEDDADAAEDDEAALNVTLTHRVDVDVPAAKATLTAKQAELLAIQADDPTPEQSDEQSALIAYQLEVGVA